MPRLKSTEELIDSTLIGLRFIEQNLGWVKPDKAQTILTQARELLEYLR